MKPSRNSINQARENPIHDSPHQLRAELFVDEHEEWRSVKYISRGMLKSLCMHSPFHSRDLKKMFVAAWRARRISIKFVFSDLHIYTLVFP